MRTEYDLVLRAGQVVLPDRVVRADVAVRDGRIAVVGEVAASGTAEVDVRGNHVLAGMIDTHVHLREPGHPHRENFASGTRSAAAGGITTVLEMPSGIPAVSSAATWLGKRELVARRAVVDFGLYAGAGFENLDRIEEQAEAGAIAFKSFMNAPAPIADPGTGTRCLPDDASFLTAMRHIARTGRVAVVHAESHAICSCLARREQAAGYRDACAHARSRPPAAEAEAVGRAIRLAGEAGARLSIAHVSTAGALHLIRAAKAEGHHVTAEACPHHLLLSDEELEQAGPYAKINPPLRSRADRDALWAALLDGTVDFVGTDHAPYTAAEKDVGWSDIWQAPAGAHGIETVLPLLLTEVHRGRMSLPQLTTAVSLRAARTFGLAGKGEVRVGADADLAVVDLTRRWTIDRARLHSTSRDAARLWDGREVVGGVVMTLVRGRTVYRDGTVLAPEGVGELVTSTAGPTAPGRFVGASALPPHPSTP